MSASLAATVPTRFLDVGDTRFAYRRFGTPAGTPLVFTQHFMGNLDNFDPAIADALAGGREIILFDNVGVGSSTGTAPSAVEGIAAGAASFIDGLGLSTVDILGHSMGGEVAQLVARDHPNLIRRLVLVGTGPRGGDAIARQGPDVGPLFGKRDQLGEDMWLPIMFSPSKESQAAGRAFISRITARTEDRDIPVSGETIAAHRAAARGWASAPADNFGYLGRITQPALVVNGSDNIVIPTLNSYHLYKHLRDAELMLLPDSGHGAHFQYVERFVRRVIDFLDVQPHDTGLLTPLRPHRAEGRPDALRCRRGKSGRPGARSRRRLAIAAGFRLTCGKRSSAASGAPTPIRALTCGSTCSGQGRLANVSFGPKPMLLPLGGIEDA